jgi:hypothetical protein
MFKAMKRSNQSRFRLIHVVLMGSVTMTALAEIPSNPYDSIVTRNPFGLKPPPPPPDPELLKPPPPPLQLADVTLTGLTSIFANKRALLEIIPAPGKPAIKATLAEGERMDSVELVSIDLDKNEVTIKNGPILTNVTFKIAKSTPGAATPPPAGVGIIPPKLPMVPGQSAAIGGSPTESGGRYNVMVAGGGGSGASPAPAVNAGIAPLGGAGAPASYGGVPAVNSTANDGLRTIPPRVPRTTTPQTDAQASQLDDKGRAMQYLQMRLSEEQAKQQGRAHPPIPPLPGVE